jgi:uncharacterized membrane protein
MTSNNIDTYLDELKIALKSADKATMQDALADAEDHLFSALENAKAESPEADEGAILITIIDAYGTPYEIASAYLGIETFLKPSLSASTQTDKHSNWFSKLFGIFADPKAWGAILYLFVSFLTGIVYFTWATVGLSLSISFAIFIFGLPFAAFFFLSARWVGLLEGRIVEALLGVRMPRRVVFFPKGMPWQEKLKETFSNKSTWMTIVYMALQLPLGILYFTLMVTLGATGLAFIASPLIQAFTGFPVLYWGRSTHFMPNELMPALIFLGIGILVGAMHLAKLFGGWHGEYAKKMLVS